MFVNPVVTFQTTYNTQTKLCALKQQYTIKINQKICLDFTRKNLIKKRLNKFYSNA